MYKSSLAILFLTISTFLFVILPTKSSAQLSSGEGSISLISTPSFPEPFGETQVRLQSNSFDLSRSNITWRKDGVIVEQGTGITSYTYTARGLGQSSTISVVVNAPGGGLATETRIISPSSVDLVWEADSTIPPFYEGKALRAPESVARVYAIANVTDESGRLIDGDNLIYTWSFNGKTLANVSGYGKSVFISDVSPRENEISVDVSTPSGTPVGRGFTIIENTDPFMGVYYIDPLTGVGFHKELGRSISSNNEEITLFAYPFFMAEEGAPLDYEWSLEGERIRNNITNTITFGSTGGSGEANIEITVKKQDKVFQGLQRFLRVIFN